MIGHVTLQALNYRKYSTASDVWSFGAVMYEMWSLGQKPFEGYTNAQVKIIGSTLVHGCLHYLHEIRSD